jgi:hypothetical protein
LELIASMGLFRIKWGKEGSEDGQKDNDANDNETDEELWVTSKMLPANSEGFFDPPSTRLCNQLATAFVLSTAMPFLNVFVNVA